MANFNKCLLAGNLTRDPELRYSTKGTAMTRFGLAINESWKDEQGTRHEKAVFVDVDAFGKTAELIGQYFRKGRPILIEGRLNLQQWDDKTTGQKRTKLSVTLESFQFLDSKRGEPGAPASEGDAPTPRAPRPAAAAGAAPPQDDDVPF
jgi:single-strand DNA-binding protein